MRRPVLVVLAPILSLCAGSHLRSWAASPSQAAQTGAAASADVNADTAMTASATAVKTHRFLRGSITHSERLEPVDGSLRVGQRFDASLLKKDKAGNNWYQIPSWAAGRWKSSTCTTFYNKDLTTGEDSLDSYTFKFLIGSAHGLQRDRHGNIWDLESPGSNTGETDGNLVVEIFADVEPLDIDDSHMTLRFVGTSLIVSKLTQKIIRTEQGECISVSTKASPVLIKDVQSTKIFDEDGSPIRLYKTVSFETKTGPFTPIASLNGRNLHALFKEYLASHGLTQLIP